MDMREFDAAWEVEYICARVKRVREAVENGDYEIAKDILSMIKGKVQAAELVIRTNK